MDWSLLLSSVAGLLGAPALFGVINRTKAFFAGRHGQPLLQPYYDLAKLLRKGATYSRTTTWIFRAGPIVGLAAIGTALVITPLGGAASLLAFPGDLVLWAYLLCLARFATVLAALDTGSSFEGMGASREVLFSALAEPALLLGLAVLVRQAHSFSLSSIIGSISAQAWVREGPALGLVAIALGIVLLAENARIPVDDPTTHLELTMIHEVMVLDHSGPDFACIQYAAALKLWIFGALVIGLVVPVRSGHWAVDLAAFLAGMLGLAVLVGIVESSMARLRLLRVPKLLVGATALAVVALVLVLV